MSLTYNGNTARQQEPDFFLLSLLSPRRYRSTLWALFAFHYEIAKTRDVVSDAQIGLIRLQWWREAVEEIYAGSIPRRHDVVEGLAQAIKSYDLPQSLLLDMITARQAEFAAQTPSLQSVKALEHYIGSFYTPLLKLVLLVLGQGEEEAMIQRTAQKYGVCRIIRTVPYIFDKDRLLLPGDVLVKHETSIRQLYDFNQRDTLKPVIRDLVIGEGADTLVPKSRFLRGLDKIIYLYNRQLVQVGYDVFDPRLSVPPPFMALRVWAGR